MNFSSPILRSSYVILPPPPSSSCLLIPPPPHPPPSSSQIAAKLEAERNDALVIIATRACRRSTKAWVNASHAALEAAAGAIPSDLKPTLPCFSGTSPHVCLANNSDHVEMAQETIVTLSDMTVARAEQDAARADLQMAMLMKDPVKITEAQEALQVRNDSFSSTSHLALPGSAKHFTLNMEI